MSEPVEGPNLDRLYSIKVDGDRNKLHPSDLKGRFLDWRRRVYWVLIAIYVALPWIQIGGHPAIQLNILDRRFYLFGWTFNAQDAWRIVFLLTSVGFGLFLLTSWLGRVWCGWACPQTVWLEAVYRRIERLIEGPREARLKLDARKWDADKLARRVAKQLVFFGISFVLAHVFLSYFTSLSELWLMMRSDPRENWTAFLWVTAITAVLWFNFAWFREQTCVILCPYGRLQSVLQDRDTITILYDKDRGEPRGFLKKSVPVDAPKLGDCIDCKRCVTVCPTGIDIRNGVQLECVGCAQCIDVCDEVMTKIGKPRGLVRYESLQGLAKLPRKILRPRLLVYVAVFSAAFGGLLLSLFFRVPYEANLLRVRGAPYVLDGGKIRNLYELHLVNKLPEPATFRISAKAPVEARFQIPIPEIRVDSLGSFRAPIFVTVEEDDWAKPFRIEVTVTSDGAADERHEFAPFLGPTSARDRTHEERTHEERTHEDRTHEDRTHEDRTHEDRTHAD